MSYNGTVYCRYCYTKGHNSRTCEKKTEDTKKGAEREIAQGLGRDGYWHKEYAKRSGFWVDGSPAKEVKKKGSKRRCKYCARTGHNTRTCEELKEHKRGALYETKLVRKKIAEALKEKGLGVGALVTKPSYYTHKVTGFMVVGFDLAVINSETVHHNPAVVRLKALNPQTLDSWEVNQDIPLPPMAGVNDNSWSDKVEVVGPINKEDVTLGMPKDWIDDDSFLKGLYEDRKSPNYYENQDK